MFQLIVFFLLWSMASSKTFSTQFPNCKTSYVFAKVCHHYDFQKTSCVPWNLQQCQKVRTSYNQMKCPKYQCVSKQNEILFYH